MTEQQLPADISQVVQLALAEDIGSGDITAALIPKEQMATAEILSREAGVFCGRAWAEAVFKQLDSELQLTWAYQDGDAIAPGVTLLQLSGNTRSILSGERTALNFLQTLSGTATLSRHYAELVAHTGVRLLDTRKTLPLLRSAQKYAVKIGGCHNHRMGLYDAYLIKENHIAACGGIGNAIQRAREMQPDLPVEIEVQDLEQLAEAIAAGSDSVLLDNFSVELLRQAVTINAGRVRLEASGGIDETTLVSIAETGVDYISIGALTKQVEALDLSLLIRASN